MNQLCIGTVKGPGETPNEFTIIAPDPERRVKHGEFVYYEADVDNLGFIGGFNGCRRYLVGRK